MKLFGVLDGKKEGWICIFLGIFQFLEMNEKKNIGAVKEWATAHCIAKQGLYCKV